MEITHTFKNIKELEKKLGYDSIEMFIESFSVEMELIDDMAYMKPWDQPDIPQEELERFELARIPFNELNKSEKELSEKSSQTLLG